MPGVQILRNSTVYYQASMSPDANNAEEPNFARRVGSVNRMVLFLVDRKVVDRFCSRTIVGDMATETKRGGAVE